MLSEKPWKLDAVARLFLGVIASICVGAILAGLVSSSKFSAGQIKNLSDLVDQWKKHSNPISAFLWQNLSAQEQLILTKYQPSASSAQQAQDVVLQVLNRVVEGPGIYGRERFQDISLRAKTIDLVRQNPTDGNLKRLNRLLLEDAWPSDLSGSQTDFWQIIISASFLEIPALILIALFLRQHHIGWNDAFGFRTKEPATVVAYGIMAGALFVPAAWGLNVLSSKLMDLVHLNAPDQQMVQELQDSRLSVAEKVFLGVVAIVAAPVVEELLFRGILYPAIKQRGWPRLALWGSSGLFALVHGNMASFVPLLIFALLLVRLYESFENLLAPVVAHSLFNTANFLVLIFQDQINRALHLT